MISYDLDNMSKEELIEIIKKEKHLTKCIKPYMDYKVGHCYNYIDLYNEAISYYKYFDME